MKVAGLIFSAAAISAFIYVFLNHNGSDNLKDSKVFNEVEEVVTAVNTVVSDEVSEKDLQVLTDGN